MSKTRKIWLGIFTFAPLLVTILGVIAFIGTFISFFSSVSQHQRPDSPELFIGGFFAFFILILLASLADLAITIYYIVDIVQDKNVSENEKVVWALALFFGSFISTAVYYFVRILNKKEEIEVRENNTYRMADY